MGKRDNDKFERKSRDFYATIDPAAVNALVDHLPLPCAFVEPCAGAGDLVRELERHTGIFCNMSCDIDPQTTKVWKTDCLDIKEVAPVVHCFITNPPFTWDMLKPILDHLPTLKPTWLLLPADYMHNVRMGPYMAKCERVVSVGRLYWEPNKKKGVDNYAWYKFVNRPVETTFYGRKA
jgi:hypothetical protein